MDLLRLLDSQGSYIRDQYHANSVMLLTPLAHKKDIVPVYTRFEDRRLADVMSDYSALPSWALFDPKDYKFIRVLAVVNNHLFTRTLDAALLGSLFEDWEFVRDRDSVEKIVEEYNRQPVPAGLRKEKEEYRLVG